MPTGKKKKKKVRNPNNKIITRKIEASAVDVIVPLVEKCEQRLEFENSDAIQMNYMIIFVAFFIVVAAAVVAVVLPSE